MREIEGKIGLNMLQVFRQRVAFDLDAERVGGKLESTKGPNPIGTDVFDPLEEWNPFKLESLLATSGTVELATTSTDEDVA